MFFGLRRLSAWGTRIFHVGGFGIQSPWAYRFERYVIGERYPYYGYDDLRDIFPSLGNNRRKRCELYFRISNYAQPEMWLIPMNGFDVESAYISRGSKQTVITNCYSAARRGTHLCMLLTSESSYSQVCDKFVSEAHVGDILIVEGIYKNESTYKFWKRIEADVRVRVTFDLYYLGIVFFDTSLYKRSYRAYF